MEMPVYLQVERVMSIVKEWGWEKVSERVTADEVIIEIRKKRERPVVVE